MMYCRYIAFLLILLFVNSCANEQQDHNTIDISESQGSQILLSSLVSDFELFPIDEDSGTIPYSSRNIIRHKQSYFILDRRGSKQVIKFDSDNLTTEVVGNTGRGPGEYLKPDDMVLDEKNNELIVFDRNQRKLIYYSLNDLSDVRERFLEFQASRFFKSGEFYYFLGPSSTGKRVIVADDELSIIDKFIENDVRHHVKAFNKSFYKHNEKVVYHTPFSPTLYTFQNGRRADSRTIRFESANFTNEVFQALPEFQGDYDKFLSKTTDDYRIDFTPLEETQKLIYFFYNYNKESYLVLHNKMSGKSLNIPARSLKNDLTFEPSVLIIGSDNEGYFLNFVVMSDDQKTQVINNVVSKSDKKFKEAEAFLIRFKIDPDAIDKLADDIK